MRNFLTTIYQAVTSLEFYKEVPEKSFWKTAGFYALFLIFITFLRAIPFIFWTLPELRADITTTISEFKSNYPQDLVINWDGQKLQSSENPQVIYYPEALKKYFVAEENPVFIGLLNTDITEASPSAEAIFTITQTDILSKTETGDITRLSLEDVIKTDSYQLNQSELSKVQTYWEENKNVYLRLAQLILPFILYVLFMFQRLSMLFMDSILFYLFRKVSGNPWSYITTLKFSMYFFVAAEFVDMVAQYSYPQGAGLFFPLTIWFYFLMVTFYSDKKNN